VSEPSRSNRNINNIPDCKGLSFLNIDFILILCEIMKIWILLIEKRCDRFLLKLFMKAHYTGVHKKVRGWKRRIKQIDKCGEDIQVPNIEWFMQLMKNMFILSPNSPFTPLPGLHPRKYVFMIKPQNLKVQRDQKTYFPPNLRKLE